MKSENEDQCQVPESRPEDTTRDFHKKSKFSYTREFLFSFAEMDICKKLPTGFDSLILRELEDKSTGVLRSYHDSDACRFQSSGCLSHWAWRNPEKGLLGSGGALARVHRGVPKISVPVVQGSGVHLLNRSSQSYQPPQLCKAKYNAGRESKDHYNDEMFGSPDNLRLAKEEKTRRDSFESMRKEQETASQEKQKIISDEHTENLKPDIAVVMEDSGVDKKVAMKYSKSKGSEGPSLTDLAECSKLGMWSKSYVSETQIDNQLNKSGIVCMNSFEKNHQGPISTTVTRNSQPTALTCTRKDLTSIFKWDDTVESQIVLPVGGNHVIPLTVNEPGPIGDDEGIMFSSFLKQTGVSRNSNLSVSNIQSKVGLDLQGGQESKHSSVSSFDELDICLPDEDSLITVDDYIFPQESMFVAAGGTSSAQVDTFPRLSDCAVAGSDNRFGLAGFASPASFHGSHDLMSSETYFNSLHMQQSNLLLHHYQLKPAKTQVSPFKSQESLKGSRVYAYNLHSFQQFPTNVHLNPPQHLQAAETGFYHSGNSQLLQEFHVPGCFAPQQVYGLPRVAFPQYTSNDKACYAQHQNAMLNSSLNFNQQF